MHRLIESLSHGVPTVLTELRTLGRTLKQRAADVLAYFDAQGHDRTAGEAVGEAVGEADEVRHPRPPTRGVGRRGSPALMEPFEPVQEQVERELELELVVAAGTDDRVVLVGRGHGHLRD